MQLAVTIVLISLAAGGLVVALAWRRLARIAARGDYGPAALEARVTAFLEGEQPSPAAYGQLFAYFVEGFERHRTAGGAGARYPGWPSFNGRASDELEGFARTAPLVAAWLHRGRPASCTLSDGREVDLIELLRRGVSAGTDPASPEYWGSIGHRDQRIAEAADIALGLWLTRDRLWPQLSERERARIAAWLRGVGGKRTADNNWHLFVVLVHAVLDALGLPHDPVEMRERYERFKSFYLGEGWFSDGPSGKVDYYNAWGIHYPLFWLSRIRPDWDAAFLADGRRAFAGPFKHFFGPHAFPVMGRSVCYRMAAPAPLVLAQLTDPDRVAPGEARRALDLTWRFFARRGALLGGNVTQGYCAPDPRVLDNYSGPASCLWSLRSLVAAFYVPDQAPFWTSAGEPLPVERGDFRIQIPTIGWTLIGDQASGDVRLYTARVEDVPGPSTADYAWHRRLIDALLMRARRPANEAAKYDGGCYRSAEPFCGFGERPGGG